LIRTPRLTLRRAHQGDLACVHAMLSHPAAMRYPAMPEHETKAQSRDWLEAMISAVADSDDFLIEHQGPIIGKACAWRLPEVGLLLHPAAGVTVSTSLCPVTVRRRERLDLSVFLTTLTQECFTRPLRELRSCRASFSLG